MSALLELYPNCASWTDVSEARYDDIDQQAACLTDYDQEYLQLSAGRYQGWFKTVLLGPHVGFFFETFNQTLDQWGACPPDHHGFVFLMKGSAGCFLKGREFGTDSIAYLPPGADFDFNAGPGTRYCVINIATGIFDLFLTACLPQDDEGDRRTKRLRIIKDSMKVETLRQITYHAVRLAETFSGCPKDKGALAGFQTSLIGLLVSYVGSSSSLENESVYDLLDANARTALEARDYLHSAGSAETNVTDLALRLGVSRRKLEYAFRAQFDRSPAEYMRLIRLNKIRSALLGDADRNMTIGDVAARYGVWHLSRLANDYRRLFGELPSETRKLKN